MNFTLGSLSSMSSSMESTYLVGDWRQRQTKLAHRCVCSTRTDEQRGKDGTHDD